MRTIGDAFRAADGGREDAGGAGARRRGGRVVVPRPLAASERMLVMTFVEVAREDVA